MKAQRLGQILVGLSIGFIAMGLLEDEWAQERFGRFCRRNARLNRPWVQQLDRIDQIRNIVALFASFGFIFAAIKGFFVSFLFCLAVIAKQVVYGSPIIILYTFTMGEDYRLDAIAAVALAITFIGASFSNVFDDERIQKKLEAKREKELKRKKKIENQKEKENDKDKTQ